MSSSSSYGLDKNRRVIEERIFAIVQEYDRYAQTNDLLTCLKNIGYYVKFKIYYPFINYIIFQFL